MRLWRPATSVRLVPVCPGADLDSQRDPQLRGARHALPNGLGDFVDHVVAYLSSSSS